MSDVRSRTASLLQPSLNPTASPDMLKSAISQVHGIAMDNIAMIARNAEAKRRLGQQLPQIACKKGCDSCCYLRVSATIPEVLNIAEQILDNFSDAEIASLKQRLAHNLEQVEGLNTRQKLNKMLPCPLLVDHSCSVHALRPLHCRSHHSVDVDACKQGLIHPDTVQIPHFLEVETVVLPVSQGIHAAIREKKLKDSEVVLVPALSIALNNTNAGQRWLAGEDLFSAAVDDKIMP